MPVQGSPSGDQHEVHDPVGGSPAHPPPVESGALRTEVLRQGSGWVAALASIAGVLVTVLIATGVIGRPEASPTPSPAGALEASALTQPSVAPGSGTAPPTPRSNGGATGQARDVTTPDELGDVLAAFSLATADPYDYATVADAELGLSMEAPAAWSDRSVNPWLGDGDAAVGWVIVATPDERGLYTGFGTPGLFFGASEQYAALADGDAILSTAGATLYGRCRFDGTAAFATEAYPNGQYELYTVCSEEPMVILQLGALAADGSHAIYLHARIMSSADVAATVHALETFSFRANGGEQAVP